ncbi:MAG: DUF1292 domain-containing protein [Lachnospiraceae bacterium]|nr:DUF1292 domain-containing protein [Lachnospiraceae bacterium]
MEDEIRLIGDDGDELTLYVIEETKIAGVNYLLAAEDEEGDSEVYILKDVSPADSLEAEYEIVEDESEQSYLIKIFSELLEDVDFEL